MRAATIRSNTGSAYDTQYAKVVSLYSKRCDATFIQAMLLNHEHTSGSHMVKRVLLVSVITCRT